MVSERIKQIGVSPTMKIAAKAISLKAEGRDIVDFSVGEPDFPTPEFIREAAKRAIDENKTKYTINSGIVPLREAIAKKLLEENQLEYDPLTQIIVSSGAKQSIYNVILSLVNPGDEVIVPAPYWVSYPEMVRLAGGKPVIVPTLEENGFRLTPEQLKNAISANTRAMILCNPSNPTGAAYSKEHLEALAEVVEAESLFVIADEIYEKLVFDDFRFVSFASLSPKIKQQTVVINGVSKAYSMTGWRIGYAAGPQEIIAGANKIQSHSTSNASTISQWASLAALTGPTYEINRMVAEFERRRNYLVHRLESIPGISCHKPEGAFYTFPNVSSFYGKEFNGTYIRNSSGLAYYLLREAGVALVPGVAFGADDFIRISYSTSMENIERGMDRIAEALRKLKTPAKVKSVALNNYKTRQRKPVEIDARINVEQRDALVAEAEAQLKFDRYYEWNANINGVIIQLRTNNGHLYDFWVENWYPAQLEADLEPHGIIYAVDEAVGRQPYGFYNSETNTAVLFNTDLYASLRSLALGMVADIGGRLFDLHAVRGMSGDYKGLGFVLMGPKGTKKSDIFYRWLQDDETAFHGNDLIYTRYGGGFAAADQPERKIYMPTTTAGFIPRLSELFERSKCENVISTKEECQVETCPLGEDCTLDRGLPYCFLGSKISAAMLDPYWLGGMRKHVKRIDIGAVFILKYDPLGEPIRELPAEDAIQILSTGLSSGPGAVGNPVPFYNPHLLVKSDERLEWQKRKFGKLFRTARVYQVNVAKASIDNIVEQLKQALDRQLGGV